MTAQLPPGPRLPSVLQTLGWWSRPAAFLERCRARYGGRFTVRLPGQPPFVMISDPEEIKQIFTAPPDVLLLVLGDEELLAARAITTAVDTLDHPTSKPHAQRNQRQRMPSPTSAVRVLAVVRSDVAAPAVAEYPTMQAVSDRAAATATFTCPPSRRRGPCRPRRSCSRSPVPGCGPSMSPRPR